MDVHVTVDTSDTERAFDRLVAFAPHALVRALNRGIDSAKAAMVGEVAADTGLKVTEVRKRMWVSHAREDHLIATVEASPQPIPLIVYGAMGPYPSRGKGAGVVVRFKGGAGRYPRAFLAVMRSNHRGVFTRVRRGRLPIAELHGPSIAHVFEKHVAVGQAHAEDAFKKNLVSEFRFALNTGA